MTESLVKVEISDGLAEITLDRPAKRNALSRALVAQLAAAVRARGRRRLNAARGFRGAGDGVLRRHGSRRDARPRRRGKRRRRMGQRRLRLPRPSCCYFKVGRPYAGDGSRPGDCRRIWPRAGVRPRLGLDRGPLRAAGAQAWDQSGRRFAAVGLSDRRGAAMPLLLAGQVLAGEEARRVGLCHVLAAPEYLQAAKEELARPILAAHRSALHDQAARPQFRAPDAFGAARRGAESFRACAERRRPVKGWRPFWRNANPVGLTIARGRRFEVAGLKPAV